MGKNTYHELAKYIAKGLQIIHSDFKETGIVQSLRYYDQNNVLSYAYLRKLISLGIITNTGTSKKTSRYVWSWEDVEPDYYGLALSVIDHSPNEQNLRNNKHESVLDKSRINAIIRLTLRLYEKGYSAEEIEDEIPKLLEIVNE